MNFDLEKNLNTEKLILLFTITIIWKIEIIIEFK